MKTTVFFHIFYPESIHETCSLLYNFPKDDTDFIFNVPVQNYGVHTRISKDINSLFPKAVILNSTNKGKDIGGKLAMLNHYLCGEPTSDYLVFLHDKKSELAYTINYKKIDSDIWKKELFSIVHPDNIQKVKKLFEDSKTGMVTHHQHIYTMERDGEYVIFGNNLRNLEELCDRFHLRNIVNENTEFAGGTMFWVRSKIFEEFFTQHHPLEIRSLLEEGNFTDRYTGTYSHSMERIFSWLVSSKGYAIRGI